MVERARMAITRTIQLAYYICYRSHRKLGNQKWHVALLQRPEEITQTYSKLNKLLRVVAYCGRFINSCRYSKANRQTNTLSTQDQVQALTCVKREQQAFLHKK
jgi:hypothetical protein